MATSRSLEAFAQRMEILSEKFLKNVDIALRTGALEADKSAVLATPFKTGRARGNWIVSVGQRPDPEDNNRPADPSGQLAIQSAIRVLGPGATTGGRAAGRGRDASGRFVSDVPQIFLTNNVPYIGRLDAGSSQQATAGMSRAAVQAAIQAIQKARYVE